MSLDDRIYQHLEETSLVPQLEIGSRVECEIVSHSPYGAYARVEAYSKDILIAKAHISREFVEDTKDYLDIGQKIEAEVVHGKNGHPYSLSLLHHNLVKQEREEFSPLAKLKEFPSIESLPTCKPDSPYEKDLKQITEYIHQITGVVSPQAKEVIERLVEEHGVFPLAMSLNRVKEEFQVDISYYFAKELEKSVKKGCL